MEARVMPNPEPLPPSPQSDSRELTSPLIPRQLDETSPLCWVIDAHDEDARVHVRIWVQQSEDEHNGLVLRQETVFTTDQGNDVWVVHRDLEPGSRR